MKTKYCIGFLSLLMAVSCNKEDTKNEETDSSVPVERIIEASNDPADGSPSLADLAAIGLTNLTESQEAYERAFANADFVASTLSDLQHIVDLVNDRNTIATQLAFGVSLAGAEFGLNYPGIYGTDYTYPTVAELDYYKSKGLKLIRLPFSWERIQPVLKGNLDPTELQRIKDFVQSASDRQVYVLLDMHNYARYNLNGVEEIIGSSNVTIAHAKDVWTKLAVEFKNNLGVWGYGIMNEPHDMLPSTPWFNIAQEIIVGIRSADQQTKILVGGDSWSSAAFWPENSDNLKNLVDPSNNLIFEAHVYFDSNHSGRYTDSYDSDGAYPEIGIDRVTPFINWLQTNNLKGFVGEYGIPDEDERWLTVLDNLLNHLNANCINGAYWAGGPWWGDYALSVEPLNGADKAQMGVVENYISANSGCN